MKRLITIFRILITLVLILTCKKEEVNQSPDVSSIQASPSEIVASSVVILSAIATDPEGDKLEYTWSCSSGNFKNTTGQSVEWIAPATTGTVTIQLTVSDGKNIVNESKKLDVQASVGTLSVTSSPDKATILLDGVDTKKLTPYTFTDLQTGKKSVSVILSGYLPDKDTITVNVEYKKTVSAGFTLTPVANISGNVYYAGTKIPVSGVTISINNKTFTTTSNGAYNIMGIKSGSTTIIASKPDYDPYSKSINLIAGDNAINIEVTSGIYTNTINGSVKTSIGTIIPGVSVTLLNEDGTTTNILDQTDASGNYQLPSVPQGQRKLSLSIPTFTTSQKDIFVSNSSRTFDVVLISKKIDSPNAILGNSTVSYNQIKWSSNYGPELLGFNLYRSKEQTGIYEKINTTLITLSSNPPGNGYFFYNDPVDNSLSVKYYKVSVINVDSYEGSLSKEVIANPVYSITTTALRDENSASATVGGKITGDGGATITERGIYWGTLENPELNGTKLQIGSGTGSFSTKLSDLISNTTYYVKAYAINSIGTIYGDQNSFKTITLTIPILTTLEATDIKPYSAGLGGNISFNGGLPITTRGVCWGTTENPTTSNSKKYAGSGDIGPYSCYLEFLSPGTTYHVRAFASNSLGIAYGNDIKFTTAAALPKVITDNISDILSNSAIVISNVSDDGGGTVSERGIYYGTSQDPENSGIKIANGNGLGVFNTKVQNLIPGVTYFIKTYAVNSAGISYSPLISFTTKVDPVIVINSSLTYGTMTDQEGNSYKTISINSKTWMAENLRTTKYNDGTNIQYATYWRAYAGEFPANYYWYNNNPIAYKDTYGALYNFNVVLTGKLCPTGWHVPSEAEWSALIESLGGPGVAGGKLKEAGTTHWTSPNVADNISGFSSLPAGYVGPFSAVPPVGETTYYWSSTTYSPDWNTGVTYYSLTNNVASIQGHSGPKDQGLSVRCIK